MMLLEGPGLNPTQLKVGGVSIWHRLTVPGSTQGGAIAVGLGLPSARVFRAVQRFRL